MSSRYAKTSHRKTVFVALALFTFFCCSVSFSNAAAIPPTHTLSIRFDLANATMTGTSVVEVPPNTGGSYHMNGLVINSIKINDKEINLDDKTQEYFADPLHELTISPTPVGKVVTVSYTLNLAGRTSPLGDMISADGISLTGAWHPYLHQQTIFNLTAEIPADFEAISEAESIETELVNGAKKQTFHFSHPLAKLDFVAGPYEVEKTPFGDGQELYTYFFPEDKEFSSVYRDKTLAYLDRYLQMIGPFPYKRFSVVENRLPTGYAMPTFTLLGQQVVKLPFITDTSLGHETLHQWFGNSVSTDPEEGNWAEGLTTYLADMLYKKEACAGTEYRKDQLVKYSNFVHKDNTVTLNQFAGAQSHLVRGQEVPRAVGYTKAAMLFQMLEDKIGTTNFRAGLKNFYKRMKYQQAGWSDLITNFEEVSGSKLTSFFSQWLDRPDIPTLTLSALQTSDNEGQTLLHFTIRQSGNGDPYELDVPVKVITDGGEVEKVITVKDRDTKVEIPLPATPQELIIDEDYHLMRQLAPSEIPPVWSGFIGAKNRLVVFDPATADIFEPLRKMLADMGCEIVLAEDATDAKIAGSSVIFLGSGSKAAMSIFATMDHPEKGVTFEARKNPLNPQETAILVSAKNPQQVALAARKIKHYSKYSYLHFEDGRAVEKWTTPTIDGQDFPIDIPPGGIEISKNLSFGDIVEKLQDKRVVYIGETHTRVEDHQLQLRIIQAMYRQNPDLVIGMEMFNRPVQEVLDRYILDHSIDEKEFLRQTHYFSKWIFDYRFYQPIINFARHNRIPVIALNIEKDIVSKVYKETGISGLDEASAAAIPAERDLSLPGYRDRISTVFTMHSGHQKKPEQLNNFLQAQSLWDETMSESIADYLEANPEKRMAVIAGRGHVDKENAIPPRVERRIPVEQSVVINVEQREVDPKTADFLLFSAPAAPPPTALMGVLLKETEKGVIIEKISPHGMAGKSGVKENDLLLKLDDQDIATVEDVKIYMFFKKRGESVKARVKRTRRFWPDSELEINIPL